MALRWIALAAFGLLSACADLTGGEDAAPQVTRLSLLDGSVIATGPQGYCMVPTVSRPGDGFVVAARCDLLAGAADWAVPMGFMTIQVGAPASALGADMAALPELLRSDAGKALLSQSGAGDEITVQDAGANAISATVRFDDAAPPPVAGLQQTEWRGFLDLSGRLATVSVRGLADAPLGTDEGLILLEQAMQALRAANPTAVPVAG